MLSTVLPAEAANAAAGHPRPGDPSGRRPLDLQLREAERALERSKRDLVAASLRAERQDQRVAEARRRMEQLSWINSAANASPDAARAATAELAAHNAAIEAAKKAEASMAAQIARLQSRLERQITRFFDLQSQRRESEGPNPARPETRVLLDAEEEEKNARREEARAAEAAEALRDQLVRIALRTAEGAGRTAADDGARRRREDDAVGILPARYVKLDD